MHIAITGAGGFVGTALVRQLVERGVPGLAPIVRLTLVDSQFNTVEGDPRIRLVTGEFGSSVVLDTIFDTPVDVLFHLASVPGELAERALKLGRNIMAPLALFERAAMQVRPVRIVNARSIPVHGNALHSSIDNGTAPQLSVRYGTHKFASEIVLSDLARLGLADAVSLQMPGIVARPGSSAGHSLSFMSAIMRAAQAGARYACPVSANTTCWWMSLPICVDNLLHAAFALDMRRLKDQRVVTLPVLQLTLAEIADALARRFGTAAMKRITYVRNTTFELASKRTPHLPIDAALELGFKHDGNSDALIARALLDCEPGIMAGDTGNWHKRFLSTKALQDS